MKTIYICEKCGMKHETWDQAMACEYSHLTPIDELKIETDPLCQYKEGHILPDQLVLTFQPEDNNGIKGRLRFGIYKFQTEVGDARSNDLISQYEARMKERERKYAQWDAERKAKAAEGGEQT